VPPARILVKIYTGHFYFHLSWTLSIKRIASVVSSFVGSDDKDEGSEDSYDPTEKEVWRASDIS
jgi:hypothetical protein